MSDFSGKLLDGYALSTTDGYHFVTPWLDLHGANHFSMIAMITGGTVTGTLTLQQANDKQTPNGSGVFPISATSSVGSAIHQCNVPAGTGQQTITLAASATPVALNQYLIGYHWARLVGVLSVQNTTGKVDIFFHWKK